MVDDGEERVADDPRVRYMALDRRMILGAKRNLCNELASGPLIAHWDDDDWIGPDRLRRQVEALSAVASLCGAREQLYYPAADAAWQCVDPAHLRRWVAGNTLCYRPSYGRARRSPTWRWERTRSSSGERPSARQWPWSAATSTSAWSTQATPASSSRPARNGIPTRSTRPTADSVATWLSTALTDRGLRTRSDRRSRPDRLRPDH